MKRITTVLLSILSFTAFSQNYQTITSNQQNYFGSNSLNPFFQPERILSLLMGMTLYFTPTRRLEAVIIMKISTLLKTAYISLVLTGTVAMLLLKKMVIIYFLTDLMTLSQLPHKVI